MVAMNDGMKMCRCCWTTKPVEEFRRRSRGSDGRLNQCRTCHSEAERCRRSATRAKLDGVQIDAFAKVVKRSLDERDVAVALGEVYRRFGGVHGFAHTFETQYRDAPPGSYRRTKMLDMVVRLTELNKPRQDAEAAARRAELSMFTDEELEEESRRAFRDSIVDILAAEPQIAVIFLEHFGYTVIPPDDAEGAD